MTPCEFRVNLTSAKPESSGSSSVKISWRQFLPRDAMHSTALVIVNLSVRPYVRLSHSWTVLARFDLRSGLLHRMILVFLALNFFSTFQRHCLQIQGQVQVGYAKSDFQHQNSLYFWTGKLHRPLIATPIIVYYATKAAAASHNKIYSNT